MTVIEWRNTIFHFEPHLSSSSCCSLKKFRVTPTSEKVKNTDRWTNRQKYLQATTNQCRIQIRPSLARTYLKPKNMMIKHLNFTHVFLYLLSQKVSKSSYNSETWVIICVSKTGCRYLNRSLPNQFLWMLDKPEVLAEVTEWPRFLPWQFDTVVDGNGCLFLGQQQTAGSPFHHAPLKCLIVCFIWGWSWVC